jgi:hypothetical protein
LPDDGSDLATPLVRRHEYNKFEGDQWTSCRQPPTLGGGHAVVSIRELLLADNNSRKETT